MGENTAKAFGPGVTQRSESVRHRLQPVKPLFARLPFVCLVLIGCQHNDLKEPVASPLRASASPRFESTPRLEFTRLIAHWAGYADPGYLPFVDDVKPEIVQVGFYGSHFWSLADTAFGKGYPANLPVRGHYECGQWFAHLNAELHRRNVKVIGHMN